MIFSYITDYRKLQKALAKRPVAGRMLGLEKVPFCRTLQVFNVGQLGEDSLSAYFESTRRSGGSGEVTVKINRQEGYAIVTFENHESKKKRSFDSFTLSINNATHRSGVVIKVIKSRIIIEH